MNIQCFGFCWKKFHELCAFISFPVFMMFSHGQKWFWILFIINVRFLKSKNFNIQQLSYIIDIFLKFYSIGCHISGLWQYFVHAEHAQPIRLIILLSETETTVFPR